MRILLRLGRSCHAERRRVDGIPLYAAPELLVRWSSRAAEFPGNLAALLRPSRVTAAMLRDYAVPLPAGAMRPRSLSASVAAHLVVLSLLAGTSLLFSRRRPPTPEETAALRHQRITWYYYSDELPSISPANSAPDENPSGGEKRVLRQTIVSNPPHPDNASQTIVQPDAPDIKIQQHVPLPNIVMWASQPPRPVLEYLPPPEVQVGQAARLPMTQAERPALEYLPAPDVRVAQVARLPASQVQRPSLEYLPAPDVRVAQAARLPASQAQRPSLEYLPAPDVRVAQVARLPASQVQRPSLEYLPAPDARVSQPVNAADGSQVGRLIAVGLDPAPPGEKITVPVGNRSGRFSTVAPTENGDAAPDRNVETVASSLQPPVSSIRVPGLSISGGVRPPPADLGPIVSGPRPAAPAAPPPAPGRAPGDRVALAKLMADATRPQIPLPEWGRGRQPAEQGFLAGKKIYTLYINMPNLTSQAGSWVLRFAELGERAAGADEAELTAPVARRKVDPAYDPSAMREGVQGIVVLYAVIQQDGSVDSVRVVRSVDPRLDENAIKALRRWEFEPARRNGTPVALEAVVQIPFALLSRPAF